MRTPDKIYLQVCGECTEEDCKNCKFEDLEDNVTWCKDRIYKKDVAYIRKDSLLKWAKEKNKRIDTDEGDYSLGYVSAMIDLIDKLNTM